MILPNIMLLCFNSAANAADCCRKIRWLIECAEEVVISRIDKFLLSHIARNGTALNRSYATCGVESLNVGGGSHQPAAGTLLRSDGLQKQARNGSGMGAARVSAGRDRIQRFCPDH